MNEKQLLTEEAVYAFFHGAGCDILRQTIKAVTIPHSREILWNFSDGRRKYTVSLTGDFVKAE